MYAVATPRVFMLSAAADIAPRVRARARSAAAGTPAAARSAQASAASAAAASSARATGHQGAGFPAACGTACAATAITGWAAHPHGPGPEQHGRPRRTAAARARPRRPGRRAGPRPPGLPGWPRGPSARSPGTARSGPASPVASANSSAIDTTAAPARRSTSPPLPAAQAEGDQGRGRHDAGHRADQHGTGGRQPEPGAQQPPPVTRACPSSQSTVACGTVTGPRHSASRTRTRNTSSTSAVSAAGRRVQQLRGRRGRRRRAAQRPVGGDDQRAAVADHDDRDQVDPVGGVGRLLAAAAPAQLAQQREGRPGAVRDGDGSRVTVSIPLIGLRPASRPAAPRR